MSGLWTMPKAGWVHGCSIPWSEADLGPKEHARSLTVPAVRTDHVTHASGHNRRCYHEAGWGGMGEGNPRKPLPTSWGSTHLSGPGPRPRPTTDWQLEAEALSGSSEAGRRQGKSQ